MSTEKNHKAGFVSIIGKPNAGKSTLMNAMLGEKLSIITSKAQTTRHRIMGLLNGDDFQVIYSDTPGILKPKYKLHESMMGFVKQSLEDADLVLFVVDLKEPWEEEELEDILKRIKSPILLVLNKVDLATDQEEVEKKLEELKVQLKPTDSLVVSALEGFNVNNVFEKLIDYLPEHPPYYPKDEMSDKPERFFASEIIREKIFNNYKQEIPYSSEVVITSFKESSKIIRIQAEIYVERISQRMILIGKKGASLKKVGIESRKDMEDFFQKQVHLETYVRVAEDWRKKQNLLKKFGYDQS